MVISLIYILTNDSNFVPDSENQTSIEEHDNECIGSYIRSCYIKDIPEEFFLEYRLVTMEIIGETISSIVKFMSTNCETGNECMEIISFYQIALSKMLEHKMKYLFICYN